jgi:hypothetical protein
MRVSQPFILAEMPAAGPPIPAPMMMMDLPPMK